MGNAMFHLVNVYRRAAQFEELTVEASYRLQKVGGTILGMMKSRQEITFFTKLKRSINRLLGCQN